MVVISAPCCSRVPQTIVSLAFVLLAVAIHAAIDGWRHYRGRRQGSAKQRLAAADSAALAPLHEQ